MLLLYLNECGEITWCAAVVDLNVEKHEAAESPFWICYDFDSLSRLLDCFFESEIMANRILKSNKHSSKNGQLNLVIFNQIFGKIYM